VNIGASAWAIRHYRKEAAAADPSSPLAPRFAAGAHDPKAVGLAFWFDAGAEKVAKVRYLTGAKNGLKIAAEGWNHPSDKLTPRIEETAPGVIEISVPVDDDIEGDATFEFILQWQLGHGAFL
jgi:hypothetical protein